MQDLQRIAREIVSSPKIILAADESTGTIAKRLTSIGVENTPEARHAYRRLLFSTPVGKLVGGAILYKETLECTELVDLLVGRGIYPGIKIDEGLEPFGTVAGEQVVKGFADIETRLPGWHDQGAVFTKFRSLLNITSVLPSSSCIAANARAQAQFALKSQQAGLVPIVEPEVEFVGDHAAIWCEEVSTLVLTMVFDQLTIAGVDLRAMILKPSMVTSGKDASNRAEPEEVAERTLRVLKATVPPTVPGVAFLSGGQGDDEADRNLNAINQLANATGAPWRLTASFGRGPQASPLKVWGGDPMNGPAAQEAFIQRCISTSAASMGQLSNLKA